jgi:transcriptional regulator with XRE-family HTH domain
MERPPAPPEAVVIRLAREAAGIRVAEAAERAGVSIARWSQIEAGSEVRHGKAGPVTGRPGTIARMAHAVGIGPDRLETEGGRPDAAEILREIMRLDHAAASAPRPAADDDILPFRVTPEMRAVIDDILPQVRVLAERAERRHPGVELTGAMVFTDAASMAFPWSQRDAADYWDAALANPRWEYRYIPGAVAANLAIDREEEAANGGTAAGLLRA